MVKHKDLESIDKPGKAKGMEDPEPKTSSKA
jgi:hypothetical protein